MAAQYVVANGHQLARLVGKLHVFDFVDRNLFGPLQKLHDRLCLLVISRCGRRPIDRLSKWTRSKSPCAETVSWAASYAAMAIEAVQDDRQSIHDIRQLFSASSGGGGSFWSNSFQAYHGLVQLLLNVAEQFIVQRFPFVAT